MMGGKAIVRTCLTLIWIGRLRSIWIWGRRGWGEVRCDELGQTQGRRCGSKKSNYANARIHSTLTYCLRMDLRQALPPLRLPLREEGRIKMPKTFSRFLGLRARLRMRPRRRRSHSPTGPTRTLHQCQPTTPLKPFKPLHRQPRQPPRASSSPSSPSSIASSPPFRLASASVALETQISWIVDISNGATSESKVCG